MKLCLIIVQITKKGEDIIREKKTHAEEKSKGKKIPFFMSIGLRAASPSFIHVSDFHAESRPLLPLYSNATDIKVNVIIRPDLQNF